MPLALGVVGIHPGIVTKLIVSVSGPLVVDCSRSLALLISRILSHQYCLSVVVLLHNGPSWRRRGCRIKGYQWRNPVTKPSNVSWLTWQWRTVRDLRDEAIYALLDMGIPALALVPLWELPGLIDGAEYRSKSRLHDAPLFVLEQAEHDARSWLLY